MRIALLQALERLLDSDFNEEIALAWGETFDMLAEAMQKHAGQNPEAQAFARLFGGKLGEADAPETLAHRLFDTK